MAAISSATDTTFSDLGLAVKQTPKAKQELGQEDFLKLMTTQLRYQDPFKPMDNGEFLGQMAQFSTVSGIQGLQQSFTTLAASLQSNQALQSAGLVGRNVLVPGTSAPLVSGGNVMGAADLPGSGKVKIVVSNDAGQVVRQMDLGAQSAGLATFNWDGLSDLGVAQPPGNYHFKALLDNGGEQQSVDTLVTGKVNSVAIGNDGLTLDLQGMEPVAFSQIRQIL